MESSPSKSSIKSPSTEFSDEFVDIVNEINDFIHVLEVRQKEIAEGSPKPAESRGSFSGYPGTDNRPDSRTESNFAADSRSNSKSDILSDSLSNSATSSLSDLGKAFDHDFPGRQVVENEYEPIANIFPSRATATATVIESYASAASANQKKPELPPKPPGLQMMVEPGQAPKRVQANHHFKGTNNDELCFSKGEIITVTQVLDGGWWEGTLNGKTGWFPSNYVREFKTELTGSLKGGPGATVTVNKPQDMPKHYRESMQYYHNVVLQSVIETEKAHVNEMTSVLQNYIRPINSSDILSTSEFKDLTGNLEDIIAFQQNFLVSLEECSKHPAHQRRVGGVFMRHAPKLKELYTAYCANHPRAVAILQKNRNTIRVSNSLDPDQNIRSVGPDLVPNCLQRLSADNKGPLLARRPFTDFRGYFHREELSKFMEKLGAAAPGSMTLTTNLSKPFTRLDKYPSLLKELERHIEESHVDRGDTQRAIAVFRDIANHCMEIRKLKEMEYEIVTSTIKGWEGEDMSSLGDVRHLSQVKVETLAGEKFDQIFVLFANDLLMLSMSPRLSGYQYEGKLPLSGMKVSLHLDEEETDLNAFEISGNMIENMIVTCGTKAEVTSWLEALKNHVIPTPSTTSSKPVSLQVSTSQPSICTLTPAKTAHVSITDTVTNLSVSKTWSMSCLRPSPPLRPPVLYRDDGMRSPRTGRKLGRRKPERTQSQDEYDKRFKRYDPRTNSEDALILKVIEAYCTSAKTRHTVNSSILYSPNVLIPTDEKIIVDDGGHPDMVQENKRPVNKTFEEISRIPEAVYQTIGNKPKPWTGSLVDTVYSLRDQVKVLELEQQKLRRDLIDEVKARKSLENVLKKYIKVPPSPSPQLVPPEREKDDHT